MIGAAIGEHGIGRANDEGDYDQIGGDQAALPDRASGAWPITLAALPTATTPTSWVRGRGTVPH